jgi:hypothetical protein
VRVRAVRVIILLITAGLIAAMLPIAAFAAENDQQVITGNPDNDMSITAPYDSTVFFPSGVDFYIPEFLYEDDNILTGVLCKSTVEYDVKINCDVTGNKTSSYMWEWNGSSYVAGGEHLQTAFSMRTGGESYAAITGTATAIPGFTDKPATPVGGTTTYVDYWQPVNYGDSRLTNGNVYRHELTFTIVNSV